MSASAAAVFGSLAAAADRFTELDLRFVALALAFQLLNLALRSVALRNVIAAAYPSTRVSTFTVGMAYAAGVALNAFAPARGGEALKIVLLRLRIPGSSVPTLAAAGGLLALLDGVIAGALIVAAWQLGALPALPALPLPPVGILAGHPAAAGAAVVAVAVGGLLVARLLAGCLRALWTRVEQGASILRTPGCYLRRVVAVQLGAWACRIGVVYSLLAAFGLTATVTLAAVVVVAGGLSTLVPVPGGGGTQQALLVYALAQTASTAAALSFSVGMQVGVTVVNTLIGLTALMLMFRTVRPGAAMRAARAQTRARL